MEVGDTAINGGTLLIELGESLLGIGLIEQGAVTMFADALVELVDRRIEPHKVAELLQKCLIFLADGQAAAGGDDVVLGLALDKVSEQLVFELAEMRLAMLSEDVIDGHLLLLLD